MALKRGSSGAGIQRNKGGYCGCRFPVIILLFFAMLAPLIFLTGRGGFRTMTITGLLCDGTIVAVKRRRGVPQQELVEEVYYLSEIRHRNLVTLLGYCQEAGSQMLVFEYLPNDSVGSHLYGNGQDSTTQLEFKQRLSIALGAAKGLCYLHCMTPPLVHKNFKTVNVLVDENFIAKVADAGISRLLERIEDAGPSSRRAGGDVFRDPEVGESGTVSELSDVYSFGVFLWELVSGQDTSRISFLESGGSLTQWVKSLMVLFSYGKQGNPEVGLVQARWSFVNQDENLLTRLQKVNLCFHFEVEQQVNGAFLNFFGFNGTVGVWRIKALEESGGWLDRTTIEDMDIVVRAHLHGWKFVFLNDVRVLCELPESHEAYVAYVVFVTLHMLLFLRGTLM